LALFTILYKDAQSTNLKFLFCMRVEVLMIVNVKMMMMMCDMMLCSSVNMYHHFWRTGLLHHTETTIVSTYSVLVIHRFIIVKCSVSSYFCNCQACTSRYNFEIKGHCWYCWVNKPLMSVIVLLWCYLSWPSCTSVIFYKYKYHCIWVIKP